MRQALRFIGDLISHLGHLHTAWGFIKFTKAGHCMAAIIAAVLLFLGGLWKSAPVLTAFALAIVVGVAILAAFHLLAQHASAPKLRYQNIVNTKELTGSPDGCWMIPDVGSVRPLVVKIKNDQMSVAISANTVKGTIKLRQVGSRDEVNCIVRWLFDGRHGCEFVPEIHIESGDTAGLIFVVELSRFRDQPSEWCAASDINSAATYKRLSPGDWKVSIFLESANCAPVELVGKFQISRDNRIILTPDHGKPCLRQRAIWNW